MTQTTQIRRIAARPEVLFEALVTVEGISSWWGPDDFVATAAAWNPQVGGSFEVSFVTSDGLSHTCAGEFLDLVRPERLVMSWRWKSGGVDDERGHTSRIEFRLRAIDIGTELTFIHGELTTEASATSHHGGWSGAFDKLTRRYGGAS
jgi:uncharacterized protein YndB with AHSA1/START domain